MSQKNFNSKGRGSGIEGGKGKGGRSREIKSKSTEERKQDLLKEGNASPGLSQGTKRPATNDSNEEEAKKMNVEPSEEGNASSDHIPSTKRGRAKGSRKRK